MRTPQSGIQWRALDKRDERGSSRGLLLRGAVVATYVIDDPHYPQPQVTDVAPPVAVYCDVLCYSSMPGSRWLAIPKAMVMQDKGSIHNGRVWKPKAATKDITGSTFNVDGGTNPAYFDGDHVLVGFLDGNKNQPIILGGIPHPSHNIGNLNRSKGHRNRLKSVDGDPDFFKHHGTFYGIDDNGDWITDTTFANDGSTNSTGNEPNPPTDGKGAQKALLPVGAEHRVEFFDMTNPDSPLSKAYLSFAVALLNLALDGGATMKAEGKDANAKLQIGDGAKHVAIVEALQTLWGQLNIYLDTHTHPTGTGPSGQPSTASSIWNTAINSTKLSIPDA